MEYLNYKNYLRKIADINFAGAVLSWDQETYMPPNGADFRSQQLATLAGISHQLHTSNDFGEMLRLLKNEVSLNDIETKNVMHSIHDFQKQKKYTTAFVELMSNTINLSFQAWQKAKENNDFEIFAPHLEKIIDLKRQECNMLGYKDHPYDALLDLFEPGCKTADLDRLFDDIKNQLVTFVAEIAKTKQNDEHFMFKFYDKKKQWNFSLYLLSNLGFDLKSGRQDQSSHPFSTNFSPKDVRITTRTNEYDLSEIIWSTIHEVGHALYEQGMLVENYGLPAGECASLGIHESQSRLWENNIGRSLEFWRIHYPVLQQEFPENLAQVSLEEFHKAMNIVKPSAIRTSADELTYHFHVIIRYEIEKGLMEGSIKVNDLPTIWKQKYKSYLGIDITSDAKGVLQDVHWSHGSFGYFPTYSLGSIYAAQFYAAVKKQLPDLMTQIAHGDSSKLLLWLREHIHQHGRLYSVEELLVNITGEKLSFKYFMEYAKEKYTQLYNLSDVPVKV